SWSRQGVIRNLVRLRIDHVKLVRWTSSLGGRIPHGSIHRVHRLSVTGSWNYLLGRRIDPHPHLLSLDLGAFDIVEIQLFGVEHAHRGTAAVAPDPALPIELQVMRVVGGV